MKLLPAALVAVLCSGAAMAQEAQDWTHFVRISGNGLRANNIDDIMKNVQDTNVFGIEVDNDIPGHYDSFLDPSAKLAALRAMAAKAHAAGNYAFVYVVGTECITGNATSKPHTMAKDHPDWLQRKITGEPAIFGGGIAFWVHGADEDVWLTPYATDWKKIYMERIRQIAATGIDGVYVDVPYWMMHFDDWRESWTSFDDYTVAAFKKKTGLNARTDLKLGDYRDANFRRWVDFRLETMTDFMREVNENVKSVNPKCKTIAEIYPGIEEDALTFGTDVYQLYPVVDTIAHEYSTAGRRKPIPGSLPNRSAERTPMGWFQDMVGMYSFRAFAQTKPTWMLTYSWEKENVPIAEAMKNLAMAQLMAGTNTWDVRGHGMGGSNDLETRKLIFGWIKDHEKTFFLPRSPVHPIGVYFSPKSRDYFPLDFIDSYRGIMLLLMQSHLEFQIVTPRTLSAFHGGVLILPDARCLSTGEARQLESYAASGKKLIGTGETGAYDETGARRATNPLRKFIAYPQCPGKAYYARLREEFDASDAAGQPGEFAALARKYTGEILKTSKFSPAVEVEASPFVATQIASVDGKTCVFLANFKGLKAKEAARQIPERNVKVSFTAARPASVYFLPFLGETQKLKASFAKGKVSCELPAIDKGAVVWME